MTILLSLKPDFVNKIISGKKKFEYRKTNPKYPIDRIIIYATAPTKKIIGEAIIDFTITDNKQNVWDMTRNESGVSKDYFDSYFNGRDRAVAFHIDKFIPYNKSLADLGINTAPQFYTYLREAT